MWGRLESLPHNTCQISFDDALVARGHDDVFGWWERLTCAAQADHLPTKGRHIEPSTGCDETSDVNLEVLPGVGVLVIAWPRRAAISGNSWYDGDANEGRSE